MEASTPPTGDGDCGAKTRSGGLCRHERGWGTDHPGIGRCKLHGGSTRNHRTAAFAEIARRECNLLAIPVEHIDPATALLEEVERTRRNVVALEELLAVVPTHPDPDEFHPPMGEDDPGWWDRGEPGLYGRTYHVSGIPTGEAKLNVLLVWLNDERKHLVVATTAALRAGIDERQVRLAERQGEQMAEILKGVLSDLGVLDHPEAATVVRRHLAVAAAA